MADSGGFLFPSGTTKESLPQGVVPELACRRRNRKTTTAIRKFVSAPKANVAAANHIGPISFSLLFFFLLKRKKRRKKRRFGHCDFCYATFLRLALGKRVPENKREMKIEKRFER